MSKQTFAERCQLAQQLLPDAQYRAMLTALHAEMLDEVERLKNALAEQPAQTEAERLADALERQFPAGTAQGYLDGEAATELRRLVSFNNDLMDEVERLQKREWVELTHEEVNSWELPDTPTVYEFAKFIEAKLKEKNT